MPTRSAPTRRVKIEHDRTLYKQRNRIEGMFGHLKINRAIATRYDQPTSSFLDMVQLGTARYWPRIAAGMLGPIAFWGLVEQSGLQRVLRRRLFGRWSGRTQ